MHFLIFKNASHFYYIRILSPIFILFENGRSLDFWKSVKVKWKNIFLELFEQKSTPSWPLSSNLHHWGHSNTYLNNDVTIFKGGGGHKLKIHGADSPKSSQEKYKLALLNKYCSWIIRTFISSEFVCLFIISLSVVYMFLIVYKNVSFLSWFITVLFVSNWKIFREYFSLKCNGLDL